MFPCEYIIDYKIKLARQLLEETALSVSEIAGSLGYDDGLAFSKLFLIRFNVIYQLVVCGSAARRERRSASFNAKT